MKTLLSFITLLLISNFTYAQTTAIPDANFEQELIDLGYDTGSPDGSVPTANINTITYLSVSSRGISDLTGIEDFTALDNLRCDNNQLTSLNVTQNTALTELYCFTNQLTSLNVSQNTALIGFNCSNNQLTSLDLSQNTALFNFACQNNQLTSLDVSQNTALEHLWCLNNQLTSLDVTQNTALIYLNCKNNQLTSLDVSQHTALTSLRCDNNQLQCLNLINTGPVGFSSAQNPDLTCIEVDDVAWATANWTNIDSWTSFSTSCPNPCAVGIEENSLQNLSLYPNPSTGSITIDLEETKSNINLSLTNAIGQVILTESYKSTNHINFDLDAPKGLYFLRLETDGEVITKKILFN